MDYITTTKKKSYKLAWIIGILSTVWIVSGLFTSPTPPALQPVSKNNNFSVTTSISYAQEHPQTLNFYGNAKAHKKLIIRSEIKGKINQIIKEEGAKVSLSETFVKLDTRQYDVLYKQAQANFSSKKIAFETTNKLYKQGLSSKTALANSRAEYDASKADLKVAVLNLNNTEIKAPFDGRIENIAVEVGEVIDSYKEEIATIINDEVILVESFIPEKLISDINNPENINVRFVNDIVKQATVNYISSSADSETKTYKIELRVDNSDFKVKDGMTTEITFTIAKIEAHKIKTSALSLDSDGNIGVKTVNSDNIVEFKQAKIITEEGEYVWLTGLPPIIELITIGHGFVSSGELVTPKRNDSD